MPDRKIELHIATKAELAQLRAGGRAVAAFADGTVGHFKRITSSVLNLRTMLAGGIFGATINKLTQDGDQVDKLSQRLAVSAEEFQVLRHAMELGGGSATQLEMAFKGVARVVYDARNGTKEATDTLAGLNVTLAQLDPLAPMEQFKLLLGAIGRLQDPTTKLALAQELFGRSGQSLMPVINTLGGNLDQLAEKMRRNGQLLSDEQIAKSAAFRDALTNLNRAIQATLFDVLEQQIGDLTQALDNLVESGRIREWGESAARTVRVLYSAIKDLAAFLAANRETLKTLGISYVVFRVLTSATAAIRALKLEMTLAGTQATTMGAAISGIGTGAATAGIAYLLSLVIQMGTEARKTSQALRAIEADGTVATGALADHARKGAVGQFLGNLGEVLRYGPGGNPDAMRIRTSAPTRAQINRARPSTPSTPSTASTPSTVPLAPSEDPADLRAAASAADQLADAKLRLAAATEAYELAITSERRIAAATDVVTTADALADAARQDVDAARAMVAEYQDLQRDAQQAADDAWNALLNPRTRAERRAEKDAEREQAKLERALRRARAREAAGDSVSKRGRELIKADNLRQAAADMQRRGGDAEGVLAAAQQKLAERQIALVAANDALAAAMPRAATESDRLAQTMANLRQEIAALQVQAAPGVPGLPALPGLPAAPSAAPAGSIAADIAAIRANTAKLLEQGIL